MTTQDIVGKLWNLCNVLKDDGVTYHQYVTELTYLLFLKMADETGQAEQLPKGHHWADLLAQSAPQRLEFYKLTLIHLGSHGSALVKEIFANASSFIKKPATLSTLVTEIHKINWYEARQEGLGDLYEGLLEKNANEKKSGAGQYFTPRVLIDFPSVSQSSIRASFGKVARMAFFSRFLNSPMLAGSHATMR